MIARIFSKPTHKPKMETIHVGVPQKMWFKWVCYGGDKWHYVLEYGDATNICPKHG